MAIFQAYMGCCNCECMLLAGVSNYTCVSMLLLIVFNTNDSGANTNHTKEHRVHNMGISGVGSPYHFDVLQSKSNPRVESILPISDLIIVEASINDHGKDVPM